MDNQDLIKKWLRDDLTEAETTSFNELDDAALYREIIDEAQRFSARINNKEVLPFNEFKQQLQKDDQPRSLNWKQFTLRIAAVLVVAITVYMFVFNQNIDAFETQYAQNEVIELPDNSVVNLNELSQISYNSTKWDNKRSIQLDGEAFFDVEKGQRFDVVTELGVVSVLGTEFNVNAKNDVLVVACYEGLVEVSSGDQKTLLPAGNEATIRSGGTFEIKKIAIAEPVWLKNMSVFDNASLESVIDELESQYGIEIIYNGDSSKRFTGAFEHNNLENALKSVTNPLHLTFDIQSDTKVKLEDARN
jgi:transmembrane sensor